MTPTAVPTQSLIIHPEVKRLPMLPLGSPEQIAIVNSVREIGLLEAIKTHKGRVVDGRERLRACLELGQESVPCVEICEGDLHTVILHSLTARKHLTKSALAYLAFPHFEHAIAEAKKRQMECLKRGPAEGESARSLLSGLREAQPVELLAESLGISRALFFLARNIHGHFDKNPELREYFEPRLLHGEENADDIDHRRPMSLGRVKQGIAGWLATKGNEKAVKQAEFAWAEKLSGLMDKRKFAGWDKLTAEERNSLATKVSLGVVQAWPEEVIRAVLETYEGEKGARL